MDHPELVDPEDGVEENKDAESKKLRSSLCGAIVFTSTSCFWCSLSILITSIVGGLHEAVCLTTHTIIFLAALIAGGFILEVSTCTCRCNSLAKVEM